ncbi:MULTISPECIES: histidine kinase [Aquimarina]|uniref:Hpt domain-containing protein n=1 Tax=Aquimarina algiphila TaxID=2047982 RepID=A0A554VP49_9FLAO|nr:MULTISPECIES: histidine kinase [Aquimarina]TSE10180.1 Hpt domain-containing protein [Aquimarina algiphila]
MEQPNLSEINKLSNGDKIFEEKIFNVIKKEFPLEKDQYFSNLEHKNLIKAAEDVHKLKHKISILGLEKSYEIATDYENNLKKGSYKLKEDFEKTLQVITEYINTL